MYYSNELRLGIFIASLVVVRLGAVDKSVEDIETKAASISLAWRGNSFELTLQSQEGKLFSGNLGGAGSLPSDIPAPTQCDTFGLCWKFGSVASLTLTPTVGGQCYAVEWQTQFYLIKDCFQLGSSHWYGGPEVFDQSWPIDADSRIGGIGRPDVPYVSGDFLKEDFGGVLEPYWINTNGFGVNALRENPLFVGWNSSGDHQLCLSSRFDEPYPRHTESNGLSLRYSICSTSDVKSMHLLALSNNFWKKPRDIPDQRMFTDPIWSTWARYKTLVNQDRVLTFASQIQENGFNNSQLEIDDRWETCYGELTFDTAKFPDPKQMNAQLHNQGFRVTLWIHPFINLECPSFSAASPYLVRDSKLLPGLTKWWQGNLAGYFDYTRPEAASWWTNRVLKLRTDFDFDGFKIDAGETSWLPGDFNLSPQLALNVTPLGFSECYAKNMEKMGPLTEIRAGWNNQEVPVFTRMLDKDTFWGKANGLATVIPTLLHFGLIGYPFVLPDMIGGNAYNTLIPDREIFVRWMQANVFMPAMQFSYAPWDYDAEVVAIAQRMTSLHYQYAPLILSLARQAIETGYPINRPIWWLDPLDPVAQTIDSEYLLGDDLLVAPVVEQGALTKDIYLPIGNWRDELTNEVYTGPSWIRDYPVPLDTLPYFTRFN